MRISDIRLDDIRHGKNWKLVNPEQEYNGSLALEDMSIEEAPERCRPEDYVVYSAIVATDAGEVLPRVVIKEAGSLEFGGDECEFVGGKWQQVGLVPNPNAPFGIEYFANPLDQDPSFDGDDEYEAEVRNYHRQGFQQCSSKL